MNDTIIWIIIAVFYAPLHFMLPVLFLFIVGDEPEDVRKRLIRGVIIDAAASMLVAFAIAITLAMYDMLALAIVTLVLFMVTPFIRVIRYRRVL
ncbi:MAG TPA: hypothetical protein ENJ11_03875 [Gammaproteobacteria bacterium]|nr:hypothetical protein [Gammaproteobacteria bacterium]